MLGPREWLTLACSSLLNPVAAGASAVFVHPQCSSKKMYVIAVALVPVVAETGRRTG
jgi:hypothetical protein